MSNYLEDHDGGCREATAPARRRTRRLASGVLGLTGAVSLVAVGVGTSAGAHGLDRLSALTRTAGQQLTGDGDHRAERGGADRDRGSGRNDDHARDDERTRGDEQGRDDERGRAREIPCDTDRLIAAIVQANADSGGHLRLARNCTYTLTTAQDSTGLPAITQPLTIRGNHATIARAANAPAFRIFNVAPGGHLTLDGVTVIGGQVTGTGGGILVEAGASTSINHSTITGNLATGDGAGIYNAGTTTISQSTVSRNSNTENGGGIYNTGQLKISGSHIDRNSAASFGGGIWNGGTVLIARSTVNGNRTELGTQARAGGIYSDTNSHLAVTESVVNENYSRRGGGMYALGTTVYMREVTVSRNSAAAGTGGGAVFAANSVATVEESTITFNTAQNNAGGVYVQGSDMVMRDSQVSHNAAVGPISVGGGIRVDLGAVPATVHLHHTRVTDNVSTTPPGGIYVNTSTLTLDGRSVVVGNRPTNCAGSPIVPAGCFG